MQIIYAFPFIVASLLAGIACLLVPRWRRFAIHALVIPPAFASCAIVGMFAIVLLANAVSHPLPGLNGGLLLLLIPIYVAPGIFGAWVAYRIVKAALFRLGFSQR